MTPRQQECLDFVKSYWAEHGIAPAQRDIAEFLGHRPRPNGRVSGAVSRLLVELEQQGLVTGKNGKTRGYRPTGKCPCCGQGNE